VHSSTWISLHYFQKPYIQLSLWSQNALVTHQCCWSLGIIML